MFFFFHANGTPQRILLLSMAIMSSNYVSNGGAASKACENRK